MASSYQLIKDYDVDLTEGVISSSPYWVVAVFHLKNQITYDRANCKSLFNDIASGLVVDPPLILGSDCITLTIQNTKDNYHKSLQATVLPKKNYMTLIYPSDWIFAWMLYGEDKMENLVARIRSGVPCNKFNDGLKFVGRVQSFRKNVSISSTGVKTCRYSLGASGFHEFDCQVFYEPALAQTQQFGALGTMLVRMGTSIRTLFAQLTDQNNEAQGIKTEKVIPTFLELLLGAGMPNTWGNPAETEKLRIATGLSQDIPLGIPKEVGRLLGKQARPLNANGILSYTDMLETVVGVQKYSENSGVDPNSSTGWAAFIPDGIAINPTIKGDENLSTGQAKNIGQYKDTGKSLEGAIIPFEPALTNKTVWSVLGQWLNPAVNEMYTALKVNNFGEIVPTFVVRQLPFSTASLARAYEQAKKEANRKKTEKETKGEQERTAPENTMASQEGFAANDNPAWPRDGQGGDVKQNLTFKEITQFLELPRWKVHPAMVVQGYDVGRSESLRTNFLRVYGAPISTISVADMPTQLVMFGPVRDDIDIQRNGLRMQTMAVPCTLEECRTSPGKWMVFSADYMIGMHLMYTGTINTIGISAPLAEGDNVEFDDVVFHVEAITHQCQISIDGKKSFVTSLTLGHGLDAMGNPDDPYPGRNEAKSNLRYEPGYSIEDKFEETK